MKTLPFPFLSPRGWPHVLSALLTAALLLASVARAQTAAELARFPEAFAVVNDDPSLPDVLIVGDSISMGYTGPVRALLHGTANVHRIPANGGTTANGQAHLIEWLGIRPWALIFFNFGLHDLAQDTPGHPRVPPAEYRSNLANLVMNFKNTGATVIFATTTPVSPAAPGVRPIRHNADVIAYNQIAREVMQQQGVLVDDLYVVALPRLAEIQSPDHVHFKPAGYALLAQSVAASIRASLE